MVFKTGRSGRAVLHGVLASVLALLAFALCMPQLAFAEEATQTIDGTMAITLLDGGASGTVAGGGAGSSVLGGSSTSGVATGDALMWLILGVVVLIAGAVYIFIKSRRLATNAGTHADVNASSKKKTIIVAVVTALIACTCFGMFASKGVAFAKDALSNIIGSSSVVVDNDGNVLNNKIVVANAEEDAIIVKSIEAPSSLSDWNASIKDEKVEPSYATEGTWDGKTIPASVLEQVKSNDGYLELGFKVTVADTKSDLNFEEFSVDIEAKAYTGQQIAPTVSSLVYKDAEDFEVTYGENLNVGEGTITIKGIGAYRGEQTYTFTIEQAVPQFELPEKLDATEYQLLSDVALPTYDNGVLAWNDPTTSVGEASSELKTFTATFTPNDPVNYQTVSDVAVSVLVAKPATGTAFAVYSADNNSLNFYKRTTVAEEGTQFDGRTATNVYTGIESTEADNDKIPWGNKRSKITSVTVVDTGIQPTSTAFWFSGGTKLRTADVTKLDTSNVTNMRTMFSSCKVLTTIGDVSQWNTSNVTNMTNMFKNCTSLTADCSKWDVTNVTEHSNFKPQKGADGIIPPNWNKKVTTTSNANSSLGDASVASVVAYDDASVVSNTSDSNTNHGKKATNVIDSTMTIVLVDGQASDGIAGNGAGSSALSGSSTSGVATGDALMWLVLGVVVLIAGAGYIFIKSRRLATNAGVHADINASSKKKTIIVAVVTALVACTCFGMFASKGVAFAKDTLNNIFGSSTVIVDNEGNVLSNEILVANAEDDAVVVKSIEAPSELSDWNASIENEMLEPGDFAEGTWDGTSIPESVLDQVKENDGSLDLGFKITVRDPDHEIDFGEIDVDTGAKQYTGQQITPTVASDVYAENVDYEVTYGENLNVGEGTITIKGINGCHGEETYTFAIEQADPQFDLPEKLVATKYQLLGDVELPAYDNGMLVWNEPTDTVGGVSSELKTFTATFIPNDSVNYKTVTDVAVPVRVVDASEPTAFAVYSEGDKSLNFYKSQEVPNEGDTYKGTTVTKVWIGIEDLEPTDEGIPWRSIRDKLVTATVVDEGIQPVSTAYWFAGAGKLTTADMSKLDTSNVTNMRTMFSECVELTTIGDVSGWDTSQVISMRFMFRGDGKITVDCSNWNVDKVEDHYYFREWSNKNVKVPKAWEQNTEATSDDSGASSEVATAAGVVAYDSASSVSNTDDGNAIPSEEGASEANVNEATAKVNSTSGSDETLQEVNCLAALSKENSEGATSIKEAA